MISAWWLVVAYAVGVFVGWVVCKLISAGSSEDKRVKTLLKGRRDI